MAYMFAQSLLNFTNDKVLVEMQSADFHVACFRKDVMLFLQIKKNILGLALLYYLLLAIY